MSEESIVQTFSGKVPLVILACLVALVTLGAGALYFGPGVMENLHVEHRLFPNAVSVELANVPSAPTRSERIDLWLQRHREAIDEAAIRFSIDPRAIAGLIAYEADVNVHVSRYGGLVLWSGPGKVHYKANRFSEGDPLSKQIEDLGMLPKRAMVQRQIILRSPRWAALYIAAEMRALAAVVHGRTGRNISCDPAALVTLVSAWDIPSATAHFSVPARKTSSFADNLQGDWTAAHLKELAAAVGGANAAACAHWKEGTP